MVPRRGRRLRHGGQDHFRLRQGGQRRSLRFRLAVRIEATPRGHAGQRVGPAARRIREDSRTANSVLFLCGYRLRAQLRWNQRPSWLDWSALSVAAWGPSQRRLLHINMRDPANVLEQEAVGILGVNLIDAAFYELQNRESFLPGVAQDVVRARIEIDYIDFRGPAFEGWDQRALLVHLVSAGFAEVVFFPSKGPAVPPTEALYKKTVVLAPGYFGHVDSAHSQVHARLLASGIQRFAMNWAKYSRRRLASFA